MRIDAHQHFWIYDQVQYSWINDDMNRIKKNFYPNDLSPLLNKNNFDGCISVQCREDEMENDFLISLSKNNPFIKGIVGWVDFTSKNVEERLEYWSNRTLIKGFRHILQGQKQRDYMLRNDFKRGIGFLRNYGFTYDILIHSDQLKFIPEFVSFFPDQLFVIDHLAKPNIKNKDLCWKQMIEPLAKFENVFCKLSGMVTEATWNEWKEEDFKPYIENALDVFGTKRLMFGSDWPVCLVSANYDQVVQLIENYFSSFSNEEKKDLFGNNACQFYKL